MPLIYSGRLRAYHFNESRGHGESLQVILAKKKKKSEKEVRKGIFFYIA